MGERTRLPRTHRGRDVLWWMEASGVRDQRYDELDDLDRARRLPSPQLVGTPERATLDLNALTDLGVDLVGRWSAVRDGVALFSGGLRNVFALADLKQQRLLDRFDARAADGVAGERPEPTRAPATSRLQLDLASEEIATVVWATGYRADYSWLDVPVLDDRVGCATTAVSSTAPASTRSASRSCAAASRPSSTASRTTPGRSSTTSRGGCARSRCTPRFLYGIDWAPLGLVADRDCDTQVAALRAWASATPAR